MPSSVTCASALCPSCPSLSLSLPLCTQLTCAEMNFFVVNDPVLLVSKGKLSESFSDAHSLIM